MINERLKELLDYLDTLSKIQASGHYVNEEIKEAVKAIRIELGLDKAKNDSLKASRFLVFEAKLGGKTTFIQQMVFEAVYGSKEKEIEFRVEGSQANEADQAITVLKDMKAPVGFIAIHIEVSGRKTVLVKR